VVVLDPFSGSGTTGLAALELNCSYLGFEIDPEQVEASNIRLAALAPGPEHPAAPSPEVEGDFGPGVVLSPGRR
jgi:DNA modification methylase